MNLNKNCISAKPIPQILSIKDECSFLFSNFLITGLCNCLANYLLDMISFLTVPPEEVFITKKLQTIEAGPR